MIGRRQVLWMGGLATIAVATGCVASPPPAVVLGDLQGTTTLQDFSLGTTDGVADAAKATTTLGWNLLRGGLADRPANAVLSPSSLASALVMVAEGATGASKDSLDRAFGLTGDTRSAAVAALRQAFDTYDTLPATVDADAPPDKPVVHLASRVLVIDDAPVKQPFLDRVGTYYGTVGSRVARADAKSDLDAWAKKNTAGLIEKSAIEVTPDIRLVLQDALLFAAKWRQEFLFDDRPIRFTKADGDTVEIAGLADLMRIPYAEGQGWQAIRLAYDDNLAMDVLLPAPGSSPGEWSAEQLEEMRVALNRAAKSSVEVAMPPSDLKDKWDLLEALAAQGITLTELDGIMDGGRADQAAQQVVLTVTAKGTVGAALTEVAVAESSPQVAHEFTADRPFVMRVLDVRSGWPLFLAVVGDPSVTPA